MRELQALRLVNGHELNGVPPQAQVNRKIDIESLGIAQPAEKGAERRRAVEVHEVGGKVKEGGPRVLLLFGLGMPAKVAFGALHGIIPVVLFTMNAVRNVNRTYLRAGRAMRLTPAQTGWYVLVPATLPEIFSGLRIGFSLTLLGTMLGELFASQRGLGFLLMTAIDLHDVKTILSIAVLISVFAIASNAALLAIDKHLHRGAAPEAPEKS